MAAPNSASAFKIKLTRDALRNRPYDAARLQGESVSFSETVVVTNETATIVGRFLIMEIELKNDENDQADQETVAFEFDRMTVARFRKTFPRARWNYADQVWTVPGVTARRRIDRWLASEAARRTPYEQERGRDAYEFEPILSSYLSVYDRGFRIRTPYSRTVVEELRQIPFARWNGEEKVWEIPYASYDELQHRWKTIEEAAKRSEPEERRKRAAARKGTDEEALAKRLSVERRRKRLPVLSGDLPPLDRPLATIKYGVVIVLDVTGELVDAADVAELYPYAANDHVWATWRAPTADELIHTWPARAAPGEYERGRGWWQPTLDELREARRRVKRRQRSPIPMA